MPDPERIVLEGRRIWPQPNPPGTTRLFQQSSGLQRLKEDQRLGGWAPEAHAPCVPHPSPPAADDGYPALARPHDHWDTRTHLGHEASWTPPAMDLYWHAKIQKVAILSSGVAHLCKGQVVVNPGCQECLKRQVQLLLLIHSYTFCAPAVSLLQGCRRKSLLFKVLHPKVRGRGLSALITQRSKCPLGDRGPGLCNRAALWVWPLPTSAELSPTARTLCRRSSFLWILHSCVHSPQALPILKDEPCNSGMHATWFLETHDWAGPCKTQLAAFHLQKVHLLLRHWSGAARDGAEAQGIIMTPVRSGACSWILA